MRDKTVNVSAKDGSPLPKTPFLDARVSQTIDLAEVRKLLAAAGYPNGFKLQFSIAQMPAAVGLDAQANAQPGAAFFPARARDLYSMSMSGWGTLSSLAHYNNKERKMGVFNVLGDKNPVMNKLLEDANAFVEKDHQRLPIVSVGSVWAMQKDKMTIKPRVGGDTLAMYLKSVK